LTRWCNTNKIQSGSQTLLYWVFIRIWSLYYEIVYGI
jgi:hypothetical protein